MKPALVLLAALAFVGCNPDDIINNCPEGSYRCDSGTPAQLQTCLNDTWEANPECDVACAVLPAGQVVNTAHYSCTCLGSGESRCDSIP